MISPQRRLRGVSAFTLVEALAAILIVLILAAMFFVVNRSLPQRAELAQCLANMRGLHSSLASYIQDRGRWPQEPVEQLGKDEYAIEDWWLAEMKPYVDTEKAWKCPSVERLISRKRPDGRPKMHYTPSIFDPGPNAPYRWSTQPWLVEIGNMHGRGANILFPDGSIRPMDDVVPP